MYALTDEAVNIGPPPPNQSYLLMDKIIEAARQTGADAIHPGYGFLSLKTLISPNSARDEGIIFIGPSPHAISTMGDKQSARTAVQSNNVPLIPGTEPGLSDEELIAAADKIGYPVMVKAAAGGGGKGMRTVESADEMQAALEMASPRGRKLVRELARFISKSSFVRRTPY